MHKLKGALLGGLACCLALAGDASAQQGRYDPDQQYAHTLLNYTVSDGTLAGALGNLANPIIGPLRAVSVSIGGSSVAANTCISQTTNVTGATTNMTVVITPQTYPGDNFDWRGYVSGAGVVTARICNVTAAASTPVASLYNLRVMP